MTEPVTVTASVVEGFVNACLARKFDNRLTTKDFHREWWDLCCSPDRYVAIAAPRGHSKSTSVTHSYLLAMLLFRSAKFAVIVSDTETQACMFLGDVKNELLENEDIIHLFGIKKFSKLSESDIIVEMNDGYRFRVLAKGAEQKLRGVKWDGLRPDLVICDDLENDEIVMNQERREKFRRWFYGALMPILSDRGKMRVVGTILHLDSLLERFMPKEWAKTSLVYPLKTVGNNPKALWKAVRYRAHSKDFSHILWPEKFNRTRLEQIRKDYSDQGMPDVYSQEYLNYPLDESVAYFRRNDFTDVSQNEWQDIKDGFKPLIYYVGSDLAISDKERADYSVFVVAGLDAEGTLYVVDVIRQRLDGRGIVETIFKIQNKYKPFMFAIEDEKITKAIGPFLREEMLEQNTYPYIETFRPSVDKLTRARSIQGRMRMGKIKFLKNSDWFYAFEQELVNFPRDAHDDQVDAFAYIGLALDKVVKARTYEQELEDEWEEEYEESGWRDQGRNATTGY